MRAAFFGWLLCVLSVVAGAEDSSRATPARDSSTVWVIFVDKPLARNAGHLSKAAVDRRRRAGAASWTLADDAVDGKYIAAVAARGATVRNTFKWGNAASFTIATERLKEVASLPFVRKTVPVRSYYAPVSPAGLGKRLSAGSTRAFDINKRQMSMVAVPRAHDFIARRLSAAPGRGVLIAVFDGGFWFGHPCLDHLLADSGIVADSDFVDHGDPIGQDAHGAQTLSLIGGYQEGVFTGVAWGARFVLARTEEAVYERHTEEDNWVAALVWAESLGVDIVSSSVGYRYDFTPPDTDYAFEDIDGKRTTISLMASRYAIDRGVIIVSASGNEAQLHGDTVLGTLNAPCDGEGVVAVGCVDTLERIAKFSSRGPTADGRMKPEVVALGVGALVPEPASGGDYAIVNGTSYAAPVVAGVCALLRQTQPELDGGAIRALLYSSCRFAHDQDSLDNSYGFGIPSAFPACSAGARCAFLHVRDAVRAPVPGAGVRRSGGRTAAVTGEDGRAVVELDSAELPVTLCIGVPWLPCIPVTVGGLPFGATITLPTVAGGYFCLSVYPSVVRAGSKSGLVYEAAAGEDLLKRDGTSAVLTIRSAGGALLWEKAEVFGSNGRIKGRWEPRSGSSRPITPGTYLLMMRHGGRTHHAKFIILGSAS